MNLITVKLGDIVKADRQIIIPNSKEAKARPYLGLEQIESQTGEILSYNTKTVEGKSMTFAFDATHILYGKLRPYLNKVALPSQKGRCSTEIIPLLPIGVDRLFLGLLLRSEKVVAAVMSEKTGSRMPRADMQSLFDFQVTIPEVISDQRRIAAELKTQLDAVESARVAACGQLADAKVLRQRIRESVGQSLLNHPIVPLGSVLNGIESGKSFQTTDRLAALNELAVLKVSAVSWTEFNPHQAKSISHSYVPSPHHRVKKGDLLMTRANTAALVGGIVEVNEDYPLRLLSDKTLRLLVDSKKCYPSYLLQALRLPSARAHLENNSTGTSDSMRNISQKTICATPIYLPPIKTQMAIASRLSAAESELQKIEAAVKQQLNNLEQLPKRLLARAFDGKA